MAGWHGYSTSMPRTDVDQVSERPLDDLVSTVSGQAVVLAREQMEMVRGEGRGKARAGADGDGAAGGDGEGQAGGTGSCDGRRCGRSRSARVRHRDRRAGPADG